MKLREVLYWLKKVNDKKSYDKFIEKADIYLSDNWWNILHYCDDLVTYVKKI